MTRSFRSLIGGAGMILFVMFYALVAMALRSGSMFGQGAAAVVKAPCGTLRGEVVGGVNVFRGVPVAEAPLTVTPASAPNALPPEPPVVVKVPAVACTLT